MESRKPKRRPEDEKRRRVERVFPRRVQIVMLSELLHCERAARLLRRELPERMDELEEMLNPERRK